MPAPKKVSASTSFSSPSFDRPRPARRWIVIALFILLIVLFLTNKGLILAAVVNGRPIFRWELSKVLVSRFGKQTLEGMISETLISDQARKSGVSVSQTDIDGKVADIMKGLGADVKLEDVLKFQGMTKDEFENQIRLQLTVEKLLGRDIQITEPDVDAYIATNRATLVATEPAALRAEARAALLGAKISEKLQPWFMELKDKAKVFRFL